MAVDLEATAILQGEIRRANAHAAYLHSMVEFGPDRLHVLYDEMLVAEHRHIERLEQIEATI